MAPVFSIVAVYYQGSQSDEVFLRGINSVAGQTFRDFEVLLYHDGPLHHPADFSPYPIRCMDRRYNDWGHSLRDRGIREAQGRYILHFNCDNVLNRRALEVIVMQTEGEPAMIVFPILMHGPPFSSTDGRPGFFSGRPPKQSNVDCMQVVMRRDLWLAEGGWSDKSKESDGVLYERFAKKYGYRCTDTDPWLPLGEHY